jgi:large subunit ribosomal protein L1
MKENTTSCSKKKIETEPFYNRITYLNGKKGRSSMSINPQTLLNAIKEAKEKAGERKFNQSVELIINLRDIDVKKPEGRIQEAIELPYMPEEKQNKICVIASGELALRAKKAGADLVMDRAELEVMAQDKKRQRELAQKYNFFLVEAPSMPLVGRILGKFLGPRGKMPVPLPPTARVEELIKKYRRTIIIRLRGQPVLQCRVGTEKMKDEEILENIQTVLRTIESKLKRGIKNIQSIYIKTAMGKPSEVKV